MGRYVSFGIIIALLLILSGCRSNKGSPEYFYREARIDAVEVRTTDSVPPQVSVIVHGTLPDACTEIDSVKQEIRNHTFILTITTRRPVHEICAQTTTPFEITTPLAVEGMPAGVYTVIANDVTASFELKTGTPVPTR